MADFPQMHRVRWRSRAELPLSGWSYSFPLCTSLFPLLQPFLPLFTAFSLNESYFLIKNIIREKTGKLTLLRGPTGREENDVDCVLVRR